MATLTENDSDEKYTPQEWDDSAGKRLSDAEKGSFAGIANNFDKTADSTQENANIDRVNNAEKSGGGANSQPLNDRDEDKKGKKEKNSDKYESLKLNSSQKLGINLLKKKGPLGFIGALLLAGGGAVGLLTSPGIAIVQMKQALMDDLNDAVAAMDYRSQHIVRAKMKQQTSGFCTKNVSVRCKYRSMSEKQIEKMRKAGMHVETSGKTLTGKYKVKSLAMSRPDGSSPLDGRNLEGDDKLRVDARNFNSQYNRNPSFRTAMHESWAPRWMSINDDTGKDVAKKHGWARHRLINAKSEEEVKRQHNQGVKDGLTEQESREGARKVTGEDGVTRYVDSVSGEPLKDIDGEAANASSIDETVKDLKKEVSGGGVGKGIGKITRSANAVVGIQAEACGWIKKLKIAGTVSRNLKYVMASRVFFMFANTADSIVDGTATFEAVSALSGKLTNGDGRKMVPNSEATTSANLDILNSGGEEPAGNPNNLVKNPDYQKNAFDAVGPSASINGETPSTINSRESSHSLTGGMGTKYSGFSNKLANSRFVDSSRCHIYENPIVQGASLLISVGALLVPGANAAVIGRQVAQAAVGFAIGFAIDAFVSKTIAGVSDGSLYDYDSLGDLDFGNSLFVGASAVAGSVSSARGMTPLSTHGELQSYQKAKASIDNQNNELETIAARSTPFDIYNSHSFLGSIAWSANPTLIKSQASLVSALSAPLASIPLAFKWLNPNASAATPSEIDRFQKNDDDPVYKDMNLQGSDLMGNIRYGMTEEQLNADPDKVVSWMIDARQVDPESGDVLKTCEALQAAIDKPAANPSELIGMQMDDEPYSDIASNDTGIPSELTDINQPVPNNDQKDLDVHISDYAKQGSEECSDEAVVRDVRTYAHFLRFCRFGPVDGRKVNFGDGDAGEREGKPFGNTLTGLTSGEWQSDGRECLKSNACKPGQYPNGEQGSSDFNPAGNSQQYKNFCRPSYYDIYATYTMDKQIDDSFDQDDEEGQAGEQEETTPSGDWVFPTTGDAIITSGYKTPDRPGHRGLDIAQSGDANGQPIYAARGGEVVHSACDDPGGFGCWMVIKHDVDGERMDTVYGHMYPQDMDVKVGDKVEAGQEISKIGNNGGSSGAHLHFEIWKGDRMSGGTETDPTPILEKAEKKGGGVRPPIST